MDEAEKIVRQTLRKSLERREVKLGASSVADIAGVIVESLKEAGLLRIPGSVVEPSQEDVERSAKAIEKAGFAWIHERDPKMISTGWADVPEEVFARAALVAFLNPASDPTPDATKGKTR